MDRRLLFALLSTTLMGAFAACNLDSGADDAGDDGPGGNGIGVGGRGGSNNTGVGAEGPADVVIGENEDSVGGSGTGLGGGGGTTTSPPIPIPDACLSYVDKPDVSIAIGPSDSHSTGSAAYAQELLSACQAPAPGALDTSHFLNLFDLGYARVDGQLDAYVHLLPTDDANLFVLQGAAVAGADPARPPVHLTFVVDTSSSTADGAMARQVAALTATSAELEGSDTIAIYGWSDTAVLDRTSGSDQDVIQGAINALSTNAKFDGRLLDGLTAGVASATSEIGSPGEHSLVVLSDGAEMLSTDARSKLVDVASEARLSFLGVGVGPAADYSPALMLEMTELASGKLHYLGAKSGFDAQSLFGDGFQRLFNVAASSATLEVTLPGYFEVEEAPQGVYSSDRGSLRQRTLAPGGTILFRQVVRVCDPAILELDIGEIAGAVVFEGPAFGGADVAPTYSAPVLLPFPLYVDPSQPNPAATTEAIITFADALKGPVKARLEAASTFIEGQNAGDPSLLAQLAGLLRKHPNHPATECKPQ